MANHRLTDDEHKGFYELTDKDCKNAIVTKAMMGSKFTAEQWDVAKVMTKSDWSVEDLTNKMVGWTRFMKVNLPDPPAVADTVVVILGIPRVTADKEARLQQALEKKYADKISTMSGQRARFMMVPMKVNGDSFEIVSPDDSPEDLIYTACLVPLSGKEIAKNVAEELNGSQFSKKCTITAFPFSHWEDIAALNVEALEEGLDPEEVERRLQHSVDITPTDFQSWLQDPVGREQIMLQTLEGDTGIIKVSWCDPIAKKPMGLDPELDDDTIKSSFGFWSPRGTYLVTIHGKGLIFRNGDLMARDRRIIFDGAYSARVSMCECYVAIWDGQVIDERATVCVFDILTSQLLKTIILRTSVKKFTDKSMDELVGWTGSGNYLVAIESNHCLIYDARNDFKPLTKGVDEALLKIGLKTNNRVVFSSKDDILAVFSAPKNTDVESCSLRFFIIRDGQLVTMATKIINVTLATRNEPPMMEWSKNGRLVVVRYETTKKSSRRQKDTSTYAEIYHVKVLGIPCDVLTPDENTSTSGAAQSNVLTSVALQPNGTMVAVLSNNNIQTTVDFWDLQRNCSEVKSEKLYSMCIGANYNTLKWSPNGKFYVIAALEASNGGLMFGCLQQQSKKKWTAMEIHQATHEAVSYIEYDPSGRFLISAVSLNGSIPTMEKSSNASYAFWSFQGKRFYNIKSRSGPIERVEWRPHPPRVLSDAQIAKIEKNVNIYESRYARSDAARRGAAAVEAAEKRTRKQHTFDLVVQDNLKWLATC